MVSLACGLRQRSKLQSYGPTVGSDIQEYLYALCKSSQYFKYPIFLLKIISKEMTLCYVLEEARKNRIISQVHTIGQKNLGDMGLNNIIPPEILSLTNSKSTAVRTLSVWRQVVGLTEQPSYQPKAGAEQSISDGFADL